MWALANQTSYAAGRNWTRDKDGLHWWLVAVRATFTVAPSGRLSLADEQLLPILIPEHHGEPGASSLRYDSDLLARKPGTDVLALASAYAPGGRAAATVPVMLRVGKLEKTLLVHGERAYCQGLVGLTTTAPRPFVVCPIRYELAFGGSDRSDPDPARHRIDERNPVGRGFAVRRAQLVNAPAHAIEYPGDDPATRGPAGFGPIEPGWLPRRALAGTYDAGWLKTRKPLLPEDYDPAFAHSAPSDQRGNTPLRGGERLGLFNMSPEGTLVFELPRIDLRLVSRFGRRSRPHDPPLLSSVFVEPDARRLSIVLVQRELDTGSMNEWRYCGAAGRPRLGKDSGRSVPECSEPSRVRARGTGLRPPWTAPARSGCRPLRFFPDLGVQAPALRSLPLGFRSISIVCPDPAEPEHDHGAP